MLNSHETQFTETLSHRGYYTTPLLGHPFSRSYGAILPNSLTKVISRALAFSARLPVSVYGTVTIKTPYEDFLGSVVGPLPVSFPTVVFSVQLNGLVDLPARPHLQL